MVYREVQSMIQQTQVELEDIINPKTLPVADIEAMIREREEELASLHATLHPKAGAIPFSKMGLYNTAKRKEQKILNDLAALSLLLGRPLQQKTSLKPTEASKKRAEYIKSLGVEVPESTLKPKPTSGTRSLGPGIDVEWRRE